MKFNSQKICVHQFHFSAAGGDAVTNQMFFIQEALKKVGISGEIFTQEAKGSAKDRVRPFSPGPLWNSDLLLVHHSQGNPLLKEVLKIETPKALVYHNITPPEFFAHDPYLADLCRLGRQQLPQFRGHLVACYGDSNYNGTELQLAGLENFEPFPLFSLANRPERKEKKTSRYDDITFRRKVDTPQKSGPIN